MKKSIEELLQTSYWIIDILPKQVPKGSPGQYFAIEEYFLRKPQLAAVKQKHINLILKVNCYRDISLDDETAVNPLPEQIAEIVKKRYVNIRVDEAMILSEPDDTHMTLFNPDDDLLELVKALSAGEGLFVWKP